MVSKQVLLGSALLLGGSVVFFAMSKNTNQTSDAQSAAQTEKTNQVAKPVVQPLTADVATEEKLLAQKQKEREAHTQQLQKQTEQLLAEQEKARQYAINKANAELNGTVASVPTNSATAAQSELIAAPTVQTRPEAIEAARKAEEAKKAAEEAKKLEEAAKKAEQTKTPADAQKAEQAKADAAKKAEATKKAEQAKTEQAKKADAAKKAEANKQNTAKQGSYTVQSGETLMGIANRHGISTQALAAANGMSSSDMLREGRKLVIPAGAKKTATTAPKTEKKAEPKKPADAKKADDKQDSKKTDAKKTETKSEPKAATKNTQNPQMSGRYTVQVAISPDKAKVDAVVKQYKAAGYKVTTTNTTKGVRVVVGNEKTAEGAKALRNKINGDSRVNSNGAFIHQVQ